MAELIVILVFAYVLRAIVRGEVGVKTSITEWREHGAYRMIKREESPFEFWATIVTYSLPALLLLVWMLC